MARDQILTVAVVDGELVIRIGVDMLAFAVAHRPNSGCYDEMTGDEFEDEVTDPMIFAGEVAKALRNEEEDGTTPVHLMLDKAAEHAIEYGADGITTADDKRYAARALADFPPETPL